MARVARFKITGAEAWYHVHSRISAHEGNYPLSEKAVTRRLIGLIEHFTSIYFCEVAAFCVMGNHYHLVVRFDAPRPVRREELEARARAMYPGKRYAVATGGWTDDDWERYRKRLFDLSELMRNVQSGFARWYNDSFRRWGKLWGDRFKSVVLGDMQAVLDCMLYVDLNPVRAGLVERPEEWQGSSIHLREIGKGGWLMPVEKVLVAASRQAALGEYRQRLYYRGAVRSKGNQAAISQEVLAAEAARGFAQRGMFRKRLRYFADGVAVGTEEFIRGQIARLRDEGLYRRRKNPIPQLGGIHMSLREQRSHARAF
ncbi:MAG TPA: hypothetical protein ENK19_09305 [Acidobacteria bacterium]|nr:hypothetical protein [Acidobacteriota bacterium]